MSQRSKAELEKKPRNRMRPDACKALLEALNIESHFMNTFKYDVFVFCSFLWSIFIIFYCVNITFTLEECMRVTIRLSDQILDLPFRNSSKASPTCLLWLSSHSFEQTFCTNSTFLLTKKRREEKENGALLHLLDEYYNNFLMKISSLLSREIILIPMWKGPLLWL